MSVFDGVAGLPARASRGDVILVHREKYGVEGLYDHYGIYESDSCVYEYGGEPGDTENACIRVTAIKDFVKDSGGYFIRRFPERYEDFVSQGKRAIEASAQRAAEESALSPFDLTSLLGQALTALSAALQDKLAASYHLYSPDETIRRARSRLGEKRYDLLFNNCEHYAIWCKTGLQESSQADAVLALERELSADIWVLIEPYVTDPALWTRIEDAVSSGLEAAGDAISDFLAKLRG